MQSLDPGKTAGVGEGYDGRGLSKREHVKFDIRRSKLETNSKHEIQRAETLTRIRADRLGFWVLVIWVCFGFRASSFGFPSQPPLLAASPVWGQASSDDDGFSEINRRQTDPFDRINKALQQYGRVFLWVGVGLSAVVAIRIVAPVQIYYGMQDRRLRRAVRPVDELLKRIGKEAEVASEAPKEEETAAENGVLAGMMEIAEFEQAEQTPPYVLTVNDMMLDNIGLTLKRLRRFHDGSAEKYQNNMFTVIHGIQTISEHSAEAGVPSGLAVDVAAYFKDEHRYKTWRKVLGRWTGKGQHQETAVAFLSFMRTVREGRPMTAAKPAAVSMGDTAVTAAPQEPAVPEILNEQTLPTVQKAADQEARDLLAFIRTGAMPQKAARWQFELVRRQQQIRMRDEAQQMFSVFLKEQRKALLAITKIQMLPCRTWGHVLHMLGVENTAQLDKRIDDRLITEQEIVVLEKAFLQTLAKRESLVRVYGQGPQADLMADEHVPEIRREALALIQRLHRTEPKHLASATETLNEEETPRNGLVKKLIEQYKSKK
jgi:hypothetical protein